MTLISAWWRSNILFQRLSGRWNYYLTRWRQEVSWFGDPLVTRCRRESPHPAEWAPGPPFEQPPFGEQERHNADGHKSGGQYVAILFGLQLPLTRNLSNKVRAYIFLKKSLLVFIIASVCILHVYEYICIFFMELYNTIAPAVNHVNSASGVGFLARQNPIHLFTLHLL